MVKFMKYTREELEQMGMNQGQINAILAVNEPVPGPHIVENEKAIAEAPVPKREYTENDITSISDIVKYTSGTIVRLPDFADGQEFVAKLKRPSMLVLMKNGRIPNSLLQQATKLFKSGANALGGPNGISNDELFEILEIICEEAMVNPTYKEIKDAGVNLSDEQMTAIFGYTQHGVKALENFR